MIKFILKLIWDPIFREEVRPIIDTIEISRKLRQSQIIPTARGGILITGEDKIKIENCYCTGEISNGE